MVSRILRSMQLEIARRSRPVASIFLDFVPPNDPGWVLQKCALKRWRILNISRNPNAGSDRSPQVGPSYYSRRY